MYTQFICASCRRLLWLPTGQDFITDPCPDCKRPTLISWRAVQAAIREKFFADHPEPRTQPEQTTHRTPKQSPAGGLLSSKPYKQL